ncbi:S8 family serine peptidase [Ornithinimicrobium faecis]|uniref:S8 family serine peptidase n=1 Tax=Ornithinimicrobium faecis TaxID=2934158 RepID=A0ABY4YWS1_9MICO|nr:S8 family serine peptidase [Ornithinimicrobium sp. HY1793]USQ81179.1 S8 family serine peptidase [Ornithinimicrobium sp. HY1793]
MPAQRSRSRVAASLALALGVTIAAPQIAQSRVVDDVTDAPSTNASRMPTAGSASAAPEGDSEAAATEGRAAGAGTAEEMPESATGLYIVRLEQAPLATYDGGVEGLAATNPQVTGEARLDATSQDSRDYLQHLAEAQEEAGLQIESLLGRDVQIADHYTHALNGLALELSAEEAAALVDQVGIVAVEPDQQWELDTDVSNDIINSPAIWAGETGSEIGTLGEGVIVGMLDTGVNFEHPSFAATDGEGYTHTNPYGSGTYVGVCATDDPKHEDLCNDKLIGAYNFTGTGSATDDNGHGSHTGSTMAGNQHTAVFDVGADTYELPVSGVAPHANVISYKVCSFLCSSTASVAAVEQAIIDGTDVLNYSISGPDNPWNNSVDLAFLSAAESGIYVAASAGNDGPGAGTVAKTAPWNAAVAATNSPRLIAHDVSVTGPTPVPEHVIGLAGVPGSGPGVTSPIEAEIKEASVVDPGNGGGCEDFPAGVFDGALALIERGGCDFSAKVGNAADAGGLGVIMVNQFPGPPVVMGGLENTDIPAVMVANGEGTGLREFVVEHPGATVTLDSGSVLTMTPQWSTMVADFSSRGPSDFDLLAPTFAAPGRNILAATMASDEDASTYEFMQGTSMSSPHGAGAGALLRGLHDDWSPVMIRSALASTANPEGMVKDDGTTPADPYDVGSGLVDLDAAGRVGLVMDESIEDFEAADPELGGDPKTLNLPAFVDQNCLDTCSWTREVTNVADVVTAYSTSVTPPQGVTMTVEPATFSIEPGATQTITVTADVGSLTGGAAIFGDVQVTTDGTHAGGAEIADVHYPVVLVKGEAEILLEPTELTTLLGVDEQEAHTVTVSNEGGAPMEWALDQGGDCALPAWVSVDPTSGNIPAGESQDLTVTFDSSDMAGGDYAGSLCVTSNDPHTPVATVTLALEVVEIPVVAVSAEELSTIQPAGTVTSEPLTIGNTGYGVLDWTFEDADAGPSDERIEQLREGVLLAPNSDRNNRAVMAFDAQDGTLIDEQFIPHFDYSDGTLYTPSHVLANADNTGFLLTDQINSVVTEYDLDGNYRGIFAPSPAGEDKAIMQNIRGMAWSPQGTLLVTVATSDNANSVVEFDADGNYLGHFIEPDLGGLDGPWFVTFRDEDVLVSASGSEAVHSYSLDGTTSNGTFTTQMRWPEQLTETEQGTVLAANLSSGRDFLDRGLYEFSADGELLGGWTIPGSTSYAGVHPLGNGNILAATEDGVFEVSRDGTVEAEVESGRARFISEIQMPDMMSCQTPDEVSWLDVDPASGQTARGEESGVRVLLDSTGLAAGDHVANLCVSTDDPATPYVPVVVTMTVTGQVCDTTVSGVHDGPVTASSGLTCLAAGAEVAGPVTVRGGSLFADDVTIEGPLSGNRAKGVEITDSSVNGALTLMAVTDRISVDGNQVSGPTTLQRNSTGDVPILLADNAIDGPLTCRSNTPPPTNDGRPNEVQGTRSGQCSEL